MQPVRAPGRHGAAAQRWWRMTLVAILGVSVGLVGCAGDTRVSYESPVLVHNFPHRYFIAFPGYVRHLDAGCIVLDRPAADAEEQTAFPVWPRGTQAIRQHDQVTGLDVPSFEEVPVDSYVMLGGSLLPEDVALPPLPEPCQPSPDDRIIMVTSVGCVGDTPADCEEPQHDR